MSGSINRKPLRGIGTGYLVNETTMLAPHLLHRGQVAHYELMNRNLDGGHAGI